jgi:hypothetical protein
VNTVPLSVLFQYKTLKENEIKERENIKSKYRSLVCRALNNLRVASAPKLPCPFGAAAGIPNKYLFCALQNKQKSAICVIHHEL